MATYTTAPEVREIAEPLIAAHHRHLLDYRVRIEYVYTDTPTIRNGDPALGTARRISSLAAFLAGREDDVPDPSTGELEEPASPGSPFFVISIWKDAWERLNERQREALVDHELCHLQVHMGKLSLRNHDVEEFRAVIDRHGFWQDSISAFARTVLRNQHQLPLDFRASAARITRTDGESEGAA